MDEKETLIIDPEFADQIPPLDPDEYHKLETGILEEGEVISPIIVWNRIIIDGYHRYEIVQKYPERHIRYSVYEKDFPDRDAAQVWMFRNHLGRRNLTPDQKNYLLGKQYEAEKHLKGGQRGNRNASKRIGQFDQFVLEDSDEGFTSTAERVANDHGVSEATVRRAERYAKGLDLAEETVPGTRQEILSGKIRPSYQEISGLWKIEDPKEREKRIEEFHKEKREKKKAQEYEEENECPATDVSIQEVKEISAGMVSSNGQADEDAVIFELNDALDTLIFRWEKCIEMNPEAAHGRSYCRRRDELVTKGINFLKNFKNRVGGKENETK